MLSIYVQKYAHLIYLYQWVVSQGFGFKRVYKPSEGYPEGFGALGTIRTLGGVYKKS